MGQESIPYACDIRIGRNWLMKGRAVSDELQLPIAKPYPTLEDLKGLFRFLGSTAPKKRRRSHRLGPWIEAQECRELPPLIQQA